MPKSFSFLISLSLVLSAAFITNSCAHKTSDTPKLAENAVEQIKKPIVVLISIDGGRFDYVERDKAVNLQKLSQEGVTAEGLISAYPSLTFPNHYTLVTGLTVENHGLIGNHFYDPKRDEEYHMGDGKSVRDGSWYGGTPLWAIAAKNGMVATSYFWVGSESEIHGVRPHEFFNFDKDVTIDQRIDQALVWLKRPALNRPHLITLYFSEVDSAGHKFGPDSPEVTKALMDVDRGLGRLFTEGDALGLPIHYIVVSDHGMVNVDPKKNGRVLDDYISQTDFRVMAGGPQMFLYANKKEAIQPTYKKLRKARKNFQVYLKKDIPARYHFKNHRAIPDILIDAEMPYSVGFKERMEKSKPGGAHGYDPAQKEMWGMFIAKGPMFKAGTRLPTIQNVNVAPLVLKILDLPADGPMDGSAKVFDKVIIEAGRPN